jgi:hypothetical protein
MNRERIAMLLLQRVAGRELAAGRLQVVRHEYGPDGELHPIYRTTDGTDPHERMMDGLRRLLAEHEAAA